MIRMDLANINSSIDLKQRELNQIKIAMDSLQSEKEMTVEFYQSQCNQIGQMIRQSMGEAKKFKEVICKHVAEMEQEFTEYKEHINKVYMGKD